MTYATEMQGRSAVAAGSRAVMSAGLVSAGVAKPRPSTVWTIGTAVNATQPCASHVAAKVFGDNLTIHPRPEEAPL